MLGSSFVLFNGEPVASELAADRGCSFGDGVFETIAYIHQEIPLLKWHKARLLVAAKNLLLHFHESDIDALFDSLLSRLRSAGHERGRIKITLSRAGIGRGCYPPASQPANTLVSFNADQHPFDSVVVPCELIQSRHSLIAHPVLAGMKNLNRLNYIVGALGVELSAHQELLYLDSDDCVIETMHHNIFFIDDVKKRVFTPRLNSVGVEGVMRSFILEQMLRLDDYSLEITAIPYGELDQMGSCFICNAFKGILPVSKIGENKLPPVESSPVYLSLQKSLMNLINKA